MAGMRWKAGGVIADRRGATIVLVALAITAILSMVALAVDIGMLFNARGEAQRAADAAALAGAGSLIVQSGDADRAEERAIYFGELNTIHDEAIDIETTDVEVDLAVNRVTVTVRRTADRGSAIPTWFARIFGEDAVDVVAVAAAQVGSAAGAACMKPWAVPDAWDDDEDGVYEEGEYYKADSTGWGSAWRNDGQPGDNDLGYENDLGYQMTLKPGSPDESVAPGWYFPWDIPQVDGGPSAGGDKYRWNIANCNPSIILLGQEYMVENGNMIGPTKQGVKALMDQDPAATWDASGDSVMNSEFQGYGWEGSPRVVYMPLFDPTTPVEPGKKPIVFNNMTAFFIEGMQGNDVTGRFLKITGVGEGGPAGLPVPGLQYPYLVE